MKKYALVQSNSGKFLVMEYADWAKHPIGYIMKTSYDEIELCREANWKNQDVADSSLMEG